MADRTIDFNPNDAGAIWTPGDTFRDSKYNVSIKVIRETPSGILGTYYSISLSGISGSVKIDLGPWSQNFKAFFWVFLMNI